MENLKGIVERITYQNPENNYTVLKIEARDYTKKDITATGYFPSINVGETIYMEGEWINHPQYGYQFNVSDYNTVYPVSVSGIVKFLGSGIIKGIGPVTAKRIVNHFKLETLDVIENNIDKLSEVEGIAEKRIEMIRSGWDEHKAIKDVMIFLASHNISTNYAIKIFNKFGRRSIDVVKNDPYKLVYEIQGIGFKTADKIAKDIGFDENSISRIKAGISYILFDATEEGHVYLTENDLIDRSKELLSVDDTIIKRGMDELVYEKRIIKDAERVFLPGLYRAEVSISEKLKRMIKNPVKMMEPGILKNEIEQLEIIRHITFTDKQKEAILKSFNNRVLILTGGPGTGKTTTIRGIIDLFFKMGMRISLAAPTGRAAKKLEETTGRESKTIHRLLEFNPREGIFSKCAENLLTEDVIIIDEGSMIDTYLLNDLLNGVSVNSRLIIVGDADQLPSVGPGNVLKDIIDSNIIEVVRLDYIFRQIEKSDIVSNAHRVNKGEFPLVGNRMEDTFFLIKESDTSKIPEIIKELCLKRLPQKYNYDPFDDIQVLTPMYKGETGANNLNVILQDALNPTGEELRKGEKIFRVGDKVMQIRNNYDKDVFNGDIGRIKSIDMEYQLVEIDFGFRRIIYEFKELDDIILAYATTVHKSQGCEYKSVIMPITTQHFIMLQRNLLYTAITRAKELMILIGTAKAINIAVKNNKISERYTSLKERLVK
jgi:exodeoxyribonuclease V alpha subunit